MSRRWSIAPELCVAVALVTAAASASAAQPRTKKARPRGAAKAAAPVEAKAEPDAKAERNAEAKPEPKAEQLKVIEPEPVDLDTDAAAHARPAKPAPPEPSASDDERRLGEREAARLAVGRTQVAVWMSVDVGSRRFSYSDPVGNGYAPYRLPAAPMLSFGAEAYPAASTDVPVLRDLGLRGRVSRGFAFDSDTPQGVALETSWTRFSGELRQRFLLPGPHAFEAGVLVGADANYFGISAERPVPALLPAARTVALRFGFDARLRLGWRLSMLLGGAYLHVTTPGEIYAQFREPYVAGVDGDVGFALALGAGFEARLTGRYTRYFARFDPSLGDRNVAGGALDQLYQAGLGVRYAH